MDRVFAHRREKRLRLTLTLNAKNHDDVRAIHGVFNSPPKLHTLFDEAGEFNRH